MRLDSSIATPALEFVNPDGTVKSVAAIDVDFQDGRRELHLFTDQAIWSLHSTVCQMPYFDSIIIVCRYLANCG